MVAWQAAQRAVATVTEQSQTEFQGVQVQWRKAQERRGEEASADSKIRIEGLLKRKREAVASLEAAHQLVLDLGKEFRQSDSLVRGALRDFTRRQPQLDRGAQRSRK